MLKQIIKLIKAEFKKSNVKSFVFFLVFSSGIWLIVQFSRSYTKVLQVPMEFVNLPKDKWIEKDNEKLTVRLHQSGFQIAWFKIFSPKIKVDLSELPQDSTNLAYLVKDHYLELGKELPLDVNKIEFLDEKVLIPFQLKSEIKLPIRSKIKINYAPGYSSEDSIKLEPDSVMVSGRKEVLDTLMEVYTKSINLKNVKDDLMGAVQLAQPGDDLTLYTTSTSYNLEVEKFTERQLSIPLTLINVPKNLTVHLYPASVEVRFKVSLDRFKQIQPIDFQVVVDFDKVTEEDQFMIPEITKQPRVTRGVTISPRKVQYIIKK